MDQPTYILRDGTPVVTHDGCSPTVGTAGMLIAARHLEARRPNAKGVICGIAGGHGGDVYWVKHEDEQVGAYGFWEFELDKTLL